MVIKKGIANGGFWQIAEGRAGIAWLSRLWLLPPLADVYFRSYARQAARCPPLRAAWEKSFIKNEVSTVAKVASLKQGICVSQTGELRRSVPTFPPPFCVALVTFRKEDEPPNLVACIRPAAVYR